MVISAISSGMTVPDLFSTQNFFQATMQGDQAESSIIAALEKIYDHADLFDVVVIIGGGGATTDLMFRLVQLSAELRSVSVACHCRNRSSARCVHSGYGGTHLCKNTNCRSRIIDSATTDHRKNIISIRSCIYQVLKGNIDHSKQFFVQIQMHIKHTLRTVSDKKNTFTQQAENQINFARRCR